MKITYNVVLFCCCVAFVSTATLPEPIKGVIVNWEGVIASNPVDNVNHGVSAGYTLLTLAFYSTIPNEMASAWGSVSDGTKKAAIASAHAAGVSVVLQLRLGDNYGDYSLNATQVGIAAAQFAQSQYLDGIDIYLYSAQSAFSTQPGFIQWIVDLHQAVRSVLGPSAIVMHTLTASYFNADSSWVNPGYPPVYAQLNSSIDYVNVLYFYLGCNDNYQILFVQSTCVPSASVLELSTNYKIPLSKLNIVKPVQAYETTDGFDDAPTLHTYITQAARLISWNTGVIGWAWNNTGTIMVDWISNLYKEELPSPPLNFTVSSRSGTTLSLTWNAPFYNGNSPLTAYTLSRDNQVIWTGEGLSRTDVTVTTDTTYVYSLSVNNSLGSSTSVAILAATIGMPGMPSQLSATSTASSILLTWGTPTNVDVNHPVNGYMLYRDTVYLWQGNSSATSFLDTELQPGTYYQYSLYTFNDAGQSNKSILAYETLTTTPSPPKFTTQLANQITPSSIYLMWSVSSNGGANITSYTLKNEADDVILYTGLQTFYNVTGLIPNTTYSFAVMAANSKGEGQYSSVINITTAALVGPSVITATCPANMEYSSHTSECECIAGYQRSSDGCTSFLILAIAIVVPVVVIIIIVVVFVLWKRHKKAKRESFVVNEDGLLVPFDASNSSIKLKSEYLTNNLIADYGQLKLVRKLGVGGSGIVYVGFWRNTEVAVKEYKDQNIETTDFIRESEIHAKLRHPNVVQLLAICLPPHLCAISEYMQKGSLTDVLENKPPELTWRLKCQILLDIAKGMDYLHKSSIIHRDLKSQNCLVDRNWCCKLADFGTSKIIKEDSTATVYVPRTAQWTAPEVITSNTYSQKSDVYSFGVILWEVLTGKLPYDGMFAYQVEDRTVHGMRLTVPEGVESWYDVLMQSCWHSDPNERPSFEEIIKCLLITVDKPEPQITKT